MRQYSAAPPPPPYPPPPHMPTQAAHALAEIRAFPPPDTESAMFAPMVSAMTGPKEEPTATTPCTATRHARGTSALTATRETLATARHPNREQDSHGASL